MKKSLAPALTMAFVAGAASTAFAAANPFSDVPADHWAYEAVAQLAAEGVVEGYGDGSYRGQQEITRFEMAQMVAKAMAKGVDSAALDKLAAEFAEELNSLGVRVANLEKKVDNVKFFGELRSQAVRRITQDKGTGNKTADNMNRSELRLKMYAQVNKNWNVQAATYYRLNNKTSADTASGTNKWMFAQGNYGNTTVDLGKFYYTDPTTEGMIFDDYISGIQVTAGNKVKVIARAGRASHGNWGWHGGQVLATYNDKTSSYQGIDINYKDKKFGIGAAFHNFSGGFNEMLNADDSSKFYADNSAKIWAAGLSYRFDNNWRLSGAYAENTEGEVSKKHRRAYYAQLDYKGIKRAKKGSWGAHVAYKHLGQYAALIPTYDYADSDMKGVELGLDYVFDKNIVGRLGYFNGKMINDKQDDAEILFSRVQFFF